jgi:Amt family ammonium transporter
MRLLRSLPFLLPLLALPETAHAQVAVADSGDTGWMIVCALLVLLAAIPGLALRHAGLVNARNALSVAAQGIGIAAGVSLAWGIAGYSLAYAPGGNWMGSGVNLMLANLGALREGLTVPESAFVLFQMSLAILATCLIGGTLAGRAQFGWTMLFAPLWLLMVYAPIAHWAWGGGWLAQIGTMDFAGGLTIHMTAGFSALALALIAGRRQDVTGQPHANLLSLIGSGLVWVGWFGITGGWALGATDDAASAILNTHFAACASALSWALLDRLFTGRTSATGIASGAMAGLVAISASAALVGTGGAILIGIIAAFICRIVVQLLTTSRVDDSANIFAIHGIGGLLGMVLLAPFTLPQLGGVGFDPGINLTDLLLTQGIAIATVALWSMLGAAILALGISIIIPLRADEGDEAEGLDSSHHGQQSWDFR